MPRRRSQRLKKTPESKKVKEKESKTDSDSEGDLDDLFSNENESKLFSDTKSYRNNNHTNTTVHHLITAPPPLESQKKFSRPTQKRRRTSSQISGTPGRKKRKSLDGTPVATVSIIC